MVFIVFFFFHVVGVVLLRILYGFACMGILYILHQLHPSAREDVHALFSQTHRVHEAHALDVVDEFLLRNRQTFKLRLLAEVQVLLEVKYLLGTQSVLGYVQLV